MEKREDLLEFLDGYITAKSLTDKEVKYTVRNVIDMDIIELKCNTEFGELNLEICHYLKNRNNSDGMTVKFKFNDNFNPIVKSKVRNAIFRKDIINYQGGFGDTELVSLQIDTVKEFKDFFKNNIIENKSSTKKGVRSFINEL